MSVGGVANLPAGLERKSGDGHAVHSATWARSHARRVTIIIAWTVASTSELHNETLTHEFGAVCDILVHEMGRNDAEKCALDLKPPAAYERCETSWVRLTEC